EIVVRSTQPLSSRQNKTGDVFNAIVDRDIVVDGRPIVPRGSRAVGRVMEATPAGKTAGGKLSIVLTSVDAGRGPLAIQTEAITVEAKSDVGADTGRIVGGSAIGAIIGGIAGGGKGAAIGAAVGGGGGAAAAAGTKGKEIAYDAEQEFAF